MKLMAEPSGISSIEAGDIKVYPNPANNELSVNVAGNMIGASVVIYNSIGQIMEDSVITGISTSINTKNYTNGFYIVKVTKDEKTYHLKIVVNH